MIEPFINPVSIATLNGIGRGIKSIGIDPLPLTPESLKKRAARAARLDDFGRGEIDQGLEVLCRSLSDDANITFVGNIAIHESLARNLTTHLLRVDLEKRRPEIFASDLVPPLIVVGLPRSGTTFLSKLLCCDPEVRHFPMWEMRAPLAPPGRDRRRAEGRRMIARLKRVAPGIDAKHHINPDEPEEDTLLFDACLWSGTFWRLAPVYGYLDWYLDRDPAYGYTEYMHYLQIVQSGAPGKRLVLKNPEHTGFLGPLIKAIPNAMVVQTHRDPVPIIASYNSLMSSMHGSVAKPLDLHRSGAASMKLWGLSADWNLEARKTIGDRIYDVLYDDIIEDPFSVVEKIYSHFELPFTHEFQDRLKKEIAERPQHKFGVHNYNLADYGLTEEEVKERFLQYRERFGV